MPNYVAIEIDKDNLLVACAKSAGRRFQIHQLFEIDIEATDSADAIGEKLKAELSDRGISRAEALGLVCRQDAEVREVSVPPAPENELPDLVRFQARNVFASLSDNWHFDFVPFDLQENQQQRVLAFAISAEVKNRIQTIAEGAGLKLNRLLFRPYSLIELFDSKLDGNESHLLVMPVANRFDMVVATGKKMVAARSFQASASDEPSSMIKQVVGECRRTIASTKSSLNGMPITKVIVGADQKDLGELKSEIKDKLDVAVEFANPLGCLNSSNLTAPNIPETPERFASLVGSIVSEYSSQKPDVDFLNPRRPVVKKRDPKKVLIPLALAGMFLVGAVGFCWYLLNQQEVQLQAKQEKLSAVRIQNKGTELIPGVDQIIGEVEGLDRWHAKKVNWLDELVWVSEQMLTADDIIISRFRGAEDLQGKKISLNAKMTEEISETSDWKKVFLTRYPKSDFGDPAKVEGAELPVTRSFTLKSDVDFYSAVDEISEIAFDNRDKELGIDQESTDSETVEEEVPSEPMED